VNGIRNGQQTDLNGIVQVTMEVLKTCLRLTNMQQSVDYTKCSRIFRELIILSKTTDAKFSYFEEIRRILQGLEPGLWPTVELQWLLTTAWNTGVYFYRMLNYTQAEKWMAQSLLILKHYGGTSDKANYEAVMIGAYSEVLAHVRPGVDLNKAP